VPDLAAGERGTCTEGEARAADPDDADVLYAIATKSAGLEEGDVAEGGRGAGSLLPATTLSVLERESDSLKVRLEGWQQDGADRVIYALMGHRIFEAALAPPAIERIERHETKLDEDTELTWHRVSIDLWVSRDGMISDRDKLWEYGDQMHVASCSTCHSLHEPDEHLANQWIGILKAMERFVALDKEQTRMLQKYLQLHASDVPGGHSEG